ncbi:MAG: oligosaccharide flippase family protein [Fimbriimonadaceae bacterium]
MLWIGPDEWGLFIFLQVISLYVGLIDVDLSNGAIKRMTEAFALGDREGAWRVQRCQFGAHIALAGIGFLAFLLLSTVLPLPQTALPIEQAGWLFFLTGTNFVINALSAAMGPPFVAGEKFAAMAIRDSIQRVLAMAVAVWAAYTYGTLFAYLLAWNVAALFGFVLNFITLKISFHDFRLAPAWDRSIMKDLFTIGVRGYVHRIGSVLANSVHLPLMAYAGNAATAARYQLAGRIPEALMSVVSPGMQTVVPHLTREAADDPQAFAKSVERYSLIALGAGIALILVPAGFGKAFLDLWARGNPALSASASLVLVLLGGYFTLELFYMMLTRAFHALGTPHYAAPFTLFNAAATLVLTVPVVLNLGIAGVAAQNLAVGLVMLVPMVLVVKKRAASELDVSRHVFRAVASLALGAAISVAAFWLVRTPVLEGRPWLALALVPLFSACAFGLLVRLGLVPMPHAIAARFRSKAVPDSVRNVA